MHKVKYPSRGRPTALTTSLQEVVLLLQASVSTANTERWAVELGVAGPPLGLPGSLRTASYEVTVVDVLHRMMRHWTERNGFASVWERPFSTGSRGAPVRIDISLFDGPASAEWRIELGTYSKAKLRGDAEKLRNHLATALPGFAVVRNFVMLWLVKDAKLTDAAINGWMRTFRSDAAALSGAALAVEPLVASAVDVFVPRPGGHRYVVVGLFEVKTSGPGGGP